MSCQESLVLTVYAAIQRLRRNYRIPLEQLRLLDMTTLQELNRILRDRDSDIRTEAKRLVRKQPWGCM